MLGGGMGLFKFYLFLHPLPFVWPKKQLKNGTNWLGLVTQGKQWHF